MCPVIPEAGDWDKLVAGWTWASPHERTLTFRVRDRAMVGTCVAPVSRESWATRPSPPSGGLRPLAVDRTCLDPPPSASCGSGAPLPGTPETPAGIASAGVSPCRRRTWADPWRPAARGDPGRRPMASVTGVSSRT